VLCFVMRTHSCLCFVRCEDALLMPLRISPTSCRRRVSDESLGSHELGFGNPWNSHGDELWMTPARACKFRCKGLQTWTSVRVQPSSVQIDTISGTLSNYQIPMVHFIIIIYPHYLHGSQKDPVAVEASSIPRLKRMGMIIRKCSVKT